MAVTKGTNSGFVETRPSGDPNGTSTAMDNYANYMYDTSPANAIKIIEVGWWCDDASEEANFEVGLYNMSGSNIPNTPNIRLEVSNTNAKGTTAGWKYATVDWNISGSTKYYIAAQLDNVATTTTTDYNATGTGMMVSQSATSTLPAVYPGSTVTDSSADIAVYAIWQAAPSTASYTSINIGDSWKTISGASVMQINIGDTWKAISGAQINIGDAWKNITLS